MIILTVNGESRTVNDDTSIAKLLETLDIDKRRVAVAVNGEVLPRNEHETTDVIDGDQVEIVRMVGGGATSTHAQHDPADCR